MLSGNKRSYILQETEVLAMGFLWLLLPPRVNNFCILTLRISNIDVCVFCCYCCTVLCTCTGYYHFYECIL